MDHSNIDIVKIDEDPNLSRINQSKNDMYGDPNQDMSIIHHLSQNNSTQGQPNAKNYKKSALTKERIDELKEELEYESDSDEDLTPGSTPAIGLKAHKSQYREM
jgi:hypothetical protein